MNLYPKYYCDRITDISPEFLKENNIKGLLLDVDNTLLDTDKKMVEGLEDWHKKITDAGIKTIIVSNSNKKEKLEFISGKLNISFIHSIRSP